MHRWIASRAWLFSLPLLIPLVGATAAAQEGDPGADLSVPTSGSNIYGIPSDQERKIWSGHPGGDCAPKLLSTVPDFGFSEAIRSSRDGSTVAFLSTSGAVIDRRLAGLPRIQARLEADFSAGGFFQLALAPQGTHLAYLSPNSEGGSTLWLAPIAESGTLAPLRIKQTGPSKQLIGAEFLPEGDALVYTERVMVREQPVCVLVLRLLESQRERELLRTLGQIDFAMPVEGPTQSFVLVGHGGGKLSLIDRQGKAKELAGAGLGVHHVESQAGQLLLHYRYPVRDATGRVFQGAYLYDLGKGTRDQLWQSKTLHHPSFSREGLVALANRESVQIYDSGTKNRVLQVSLEDADGNPLEVEAASWHPTKPWLALVTSKSVRVLDLEGKLPHDASRDEQPQVIVFERGRANPTLHRVAAIRGQRVGRRVAWQGERLLWSDQHEAPARRLETPRFRTPPVR